MRQGGELPFALGGVDGGGDAVVAGEDAVDVAVDDGGGEVEGKGADGSGGVVAYALQRADAFEGGGETACSHNLAGSRVEVACPAVVAQSLPLAQHFVLGGGGQVGHCRPSVHEALPVGQSLLYARLLQDDFGEPDGIRVACLPPGQVAAVLAEPV